MSKIISKQIMLADGWEEKEEKSNLLWGLQICEDWVDLIEFIIQKFIQTMGSSPHTCAANMVR